MSQKWLFPECSLVSQFRFYIYSIPLVLLRCYRSVLDSTSLHREPISPLIYLPYSFGSFIFIPKIQNLWLVAQLRENIIHSSCRPSHSSFPLPWFFGSFPSFLLSFLHSFLLLSLRQYFSVVLELALMSSK